MTLSLDDALAVIQDHLDRYMKEPAEQATPMKPQEVDESLQWMSAANYGAAVHLTRLQKAGADLVRQDGKNIGLWIVEQVKLGNVARSTRIDYQKRHGLPIDDWTSPAVPGPDFRVSKIPTSPFRSSDLCRSYRRGSEAISAAGPVGDPATRAASWIAGVPGPVRSVPLCRYWHTYLKLSADRSPPRPASNMRPLQRSTAPAQRRRAHDRPSLAQLRFATSVTNP